MIKSSGVAIKAAILALALVAFLLPEHGQGGLSRAAGADHRTDRAWRLV